MTDVLKIRIAIVATVLSLLMVTNGAAQQSSTIDSLSAVPTNAVAFAHVDVEEMMGTQEMILPTEFLAGIKIEADALFQQHFGVKISQLSSATFVAPTFESLMALQGSGPQDSFGLFVFTQPLESKLGENTLPESWRAKKLGDSTILVDDETELAIFQIDSNSIAIGSENGIRWFIQNRENFADSSLRSAMKLADSGHITIGINGDAIPSEMKSFFPPEMKSLANAKSAAVNLDFSNGIAARAQMIFNSVDAATQTVALAEINIDAVQSTLQQLELGAQEQFKAESSDISAALDPLFQLAAIRFGGKLLENVRINQAGENVNAEFALDGFDGQMLVITGLTAIQAIGTSAKAEFQDISDQLDAAHE